MRSCPMRDPENFEEAMAVLVAAIGHIANIPPATEEDSWRMGEQVARLDGIWARNHRVVTK